MAAQISPEIVTTVLDFIDYAIAAAVLMAIYFGFRFLFYEGDKAGDGVAGGEPVEELKEKWNKSIWKKKLEQGKRKSLLEPAKGFLIRAMQHCDSGREQFEVQSATGLRRGRGHVEQVQHNLNSARRVMRGAWHRARDEQREDLKNLIVSVEALRNEVHKDVISRLSPGPTVPDRLLVEIRTSLEKIEPKIGAIIQEIDECIEDDKPEPKAEDSGEDSRSGPSPRGRSP